MFSVNALHMYTKYIYYITIADLLCNKLDAIDDIYHCVVMHRLLLHRGGRWSLQELL